MNFIYGYISDALVWLHSFVGDWGLSIVLITLAVRVILLPLTIHQKLSFGRQAELSKKMQDIKTKYKNDKEKQEQELGKLSSESAKSMFGCLTLILQLPIMYSLYRAFSTIQADAGSFLVPWVENLKFADAYFIVPVVSTAIQLLPNILTAFGAFKSLNLPKPTKSQYLITIAFNIMFMVKAPVALGIYWITAGLFSLLEQFVSSIWARKQNLNKLYS